VRGLFLLLILLFGIAQAEEPQLLDPKDAFKFSARVLNDSTIEVAYKIAPGYYLYREKFKFSDKTSAVRLHSAEFPAGEVKNDEFFGKMEIYRDEVRIRIPISRFENMGANLDLASVSQGCADIGVCFPPHTSNALLKLASADTAGIGGTVSDVGGKASSLAALQAAAEGAANAQPDFIAPKDAPAAQPEPAVVAQAEAPAAEPQSLSETDKIAAVLATGQLWKIIGFFFVAGLLLAFTPCVLPMVPILSGIIVGQGPELTRARGFTLSFAYVLGMAVTYAIAGVIAGLSGGLLSSALQNVWVLSSFGLLFLLLALSMFDVYELQMPAGWQAKMADASNRLPGGKYAAVTGMGALSALIVGPCVAAPLAGALLYIAQHHDVVLGGMALFALALGMGAPVLLVGASAGALLPKAGAWMNAVKRFFGVLLLAVAIWIISPVLPATATMLLWAALLIVSAMFLRAIDPLPVEVSGYSRLFKGVGIMALVGGIALLVGALSGSKDVLQPLSGLRGAVGSASEEPAPVRFERVKSVQDLDARIAAAHGKYVMLDFYADWCVSCKEMERFTFADPQVRGRLKDVVLLQADVTANSDADQALLKRFELFGPPGIILFGPDGKEIRSFRVVGYQPSAEFSATLARAMPQG
jgi:thioredoxin:protein disulfide reductase